MDGYLTENVMHMGEVGYDITAFSGSTLCQFILPVWGLGCQWFHLGLSQTLADSGSCRVKETAIS